MSPLELIRQEMPSSFILRYKVLELIPSIWAAWFFRLPQAASAFRIASSLAELTAVLSAVPEAGWAES